MAGGSAFLALAGPVGLGLAAVCAVGGALYVRSKNASIAEEANGKRQQVEAQRAATEVVRVEIGEILDLTKQQASGIRSLLSAVKADAPASYRDFDSDRKEKLGAVINHVRVLGELLGRRIGPGKPAQISEWPFPLAT